MSVQVNTYLIVGVRLPYNNNYKKIEEDYLDSAYEGIHHFNGLCILADGMSGEYFIIGRVLFKTECDEHFYKPIEIEYSQNLIDEVSQLINEQFEIESPEVKYWIVPHYR